MLHGLLAMAPVDLGHVAALGVALAAAVVDLRSRRIPNALTVTAAVLGLAWQAATGGTSGLVGSAAGVAIGGAVFFPIFALGGLGGGDVKLMAALGAWVGPIPVLWIAIYTAMAGAMLAVVVSLAWGYVGEAIRNLRNLVVLWATGGVRAVPALTLESSRGPRLAYAIPILVGTAGALWWR
ncbi:MAG: A24 family peptidase [Vicinamibacterales bacterium]